MRDKFISALALGLGLLASGPADAEEVKAEVNFAWLSVGTSFTISEGHIYWVGEFSGTSSDVAGGNSIFDNSASQCPAWFDIDFPNQKSAAGGYCVTTLASGDTVQISWHCEGSLAGATGQGPFPFGKDNPCNGVSTVVGGTGKLAKATGGNTFLGRTILFHPDGKGSGLSPITWHLVIPD